MVARDVGHAEMRVEDDEVDLRHEPQHALPVTGGESGAAECCDGRAAGLQQAAACDADHDSFPSRPDVAGICEVCRVACTVSSSRFGSVGWRMPNHLLDTVEGKRL